MRLRTGAAPHARISNVKARILYCRCAYARTIPDDVRDRVLQRLRESGVEFEAVADLCELAARRDPALARMLDGPEVRIIACFPRAVKWLLHAAGVSLEGRALTVLNMRAPDAAAIIERALRDKPAAGSRRGAEPELDAAGTWKPWFPVIDYDRCKDCKQCLSFCLFGVYAVGEDGKVKVVRPANCKTDCPACARVCPHAAIMFPKFEEAPINGEEVTEEILARSTVMVDVSGVDPKDIRVALRNRTLRGAKPKSG